MILMWNFGCIFNKELVKTFRKKKGYDKEAAKRIWRDDKNTLDLVCGDGYMALCICQNSELHTKKSEFYCIKR